MMVDVLGMRLQPRTLLGLLVAFGSAQFMTAMMLGEAIAPDYSMHTNAISDMGTIPETRLLFNTSLVVIGLFNFAAGVILYRFLDNRMLGVVFMIGGVGAIGAGLIPLDSKIGIHGLFALVAFLFINAEAVLSSRLVRNPLKIIFIAMGAIGFFFTVVMMLVDGGSLDLSGSIGHGGTERMIVYPALIWMMIFGGLQLAQSQLKATGGSNPA
jgi:hypothetical membrane protein